MGHPLSSLILSAALALAPALASAAPLATRLFGAEKAPSQGQAQAIGTYTRGCAAGLVELPPNGPHWQEMRLSRNRNWGMPETVAFVEDLGTYAATLKGWNGIYVGDIGQPRGGPRCAPGTRATRWGWTSISGCGRAPTCTCRAPRARRSARSRYAPQTRPG